MPKLSHNQRLIILRALASEARSIIESMERDVLYDTYNENRKHKFEDTGVALCELGAVGRTLKAVLEED